MNDNAYEQARFKLDYPAADLPFEFGIVTACNPNGTTLDALVNEGLDRGLGLSLLGQRIPHFRVTGGSEDMSHSEPGYGCVADHEKIVELGRQWKQDAIFRVRGDSLFLVYCDRPQDEKPLGSFRERVI
jgi:hypothetical protein